MVLFLFPKVGKMVSMGKESVGGVAVCGLALKEISILFICMLNQSYQVNKKIWKSMHLVQSLEQN